LKRVEKGYFDPDGGKLSRAAVYALRWLNQAANEQTSSKNVPAEIMELNRFKKQTGTGSKNVPADQFKKRTGIEINK